MHMMSKKELSSEEMGTVKRSRTLTVVLIANGEVHTHEESQVFVHDLNQFVTVQLLEETLLSYRWASFAKIRDTPMSGSAVKSHDSPKMRKALSARQFCTSSRSRVICHFWKQFVSNIATTGIVETRSRPSIWNRAASSSSSGSVFERSDEQARRLGHESLRSDNNDANDPLADLHSG